MPRGGHRGCLFAVSGRAASALGRRRRRGLYHHCTSEIFRPAWGPLRQPWLTLAARLPNWSSGALAPAERLPPAPQYHRDARLAFPVQRHSFVLNMYRRNVNRYFQPAAAANDEHVRSYIYNVLEPSHRKSFSGIGVDFAGQTRQCSSRHIGEVVRDVNAVSAPSLDLKPREDYAPRFRRLESLIRQSDAWRDVAPLQESQSANPFPHVNEGASLVRDLALAEVLHVRSNHRLARRAHPKWYAARYRKFVAKRALQEKLVQLGGTAAAHS